MVAAGDTPDAITDDQRALMVAKIAQTAGVPASAVRLTIVAASILLIFEITAPDAPTASTIVETFSAQVATPEQANALMAGASPVTIITAPAVKKLVTLVQAPEQPPPPSTPPPADPVAQGGQSSSGAVVGGVVAAVAVILIVAAALAVRRRQRAKGMALGAKPTGAKLEVHEFGAIEMASSTVEVNLEGVERDSKPHPPPVEQPKR